MQPDKTSDPVSLVIKACHKNEDEANRIYHMLAEERQHQITLDSETTIHLNDEQLGEFAERFSSEVEPEYWVSKRLKHWKDGWFTCLHHESPVPYRLAQDLFELETS